MDAVAVITTAAIASFRGFVAETYCWLVLSSVVLITVAAYDFYGIAVADGAVAMGTMAVFYRHRCVSFHFQSFIGEILVHDRSFINNALMAKTLKP